MGANITPTNDHQAKDLEEPMEACLLRNISDSSDVDHSQERFVERTGTGWSATAHIITGVMGAGVLSLSWSTAQLGWIAAPIFIIVFALAILFSNLLLSECYKSPHQFGASPTRSFTEAVKFYLGAEKQRICAVFLLVGLYGLGVAYIITATESVSAIQKSNCYHREGQHANCGGHENSSFMLVFGVVQIILSQMPNFYNTAWLSNVAAVMSFCYAFTGLALGLAKVTENGKFRGSISGVPTDTRIEKLWLVLQALGDIAFAYPYSVIVLDIQDTLKSPPSVRRTMKKASSTSVIIITLFYLSCGCVGYAAFGDETPGNLLTGFGFYEPYWLVDFANACIILHLVGAFQVFSQPVFGLFENWFNTKFPNNANASKVNVKLPFLPALQLNIVKLCFRTVYVASVVGIAMQFPYFNQVLGLMGALNFWCLSIYFPLEMYIVHRNIGPWTRKWILFKAFSFICLLMSILIFIGSFQGLVSAKLS